MRSRNVIRASAAKAKPPGVQRLLLEVLLDIREHLKPTPSVIVTKQLKEPTAQDLGARILLLEKDLEREQKTNQYLTEDINRRERLHYAVAGFAKSMMRKEVDCTGCDRPAVFGDAPAAPHSPHCLLCMINGDIRMPPNYPPART